MGTLTKQKTGTIDEMFIDCLTPQDEGKFKTVSVPGITTPRLVFFDFYTLEGYRAAVHSLVSDFLRSFSSAEGDSFNNTVKNSFGDVWCRDEKKREKLVQLAIGLGLMEFVEPREQWADLPKGRPSIRFVQR